MLQRMNAAAPAPDAAIQIRLADPRELFDTLDPAPFRGRRLDPQAEAYLLDRAAGLPSTGAVSLRLHLPDAAAGEGLPALLAGVFAARAAAEGARLREHFWQARTALVVGLAGLAACLALAAAAEAMLGVRSPLGLMAEGLTILGWVLLWKPAEMFLYDWMPIRRRRRLFRRLAAARIAVITPGADAPDTTMEPKP